MSETKTETQTAPQDHSSEIKELFVDLSNGILNAYEAYEKMQLEKDLNEVKELQFECYSLLITTSDEIGEFLKAFRRQFGVKDKEVRKRLAEEEAEEKKA